MEDRAKAAAEASRAKSSDSDALLGNYVTPGLSGQPVSSVDSSASFTPDIACQKTATLLEVLVQPGSTGDLGTVQISRDTDLDGIVDTTGHLPLPLSGICANGVIACQPGTWTQCRYFRWDVDAARALKLSEVDMPALAGCYCLNNSCGANLAWANMPSVLTDLGGGMIGALTSADARFGIAQAVINGPSIRYVGAQTTACAGDPGLSQVAYRANPSALAGDAQAASGGNQLFQALIGSPVGLGTLQETRSCTLERQVEIEGATIDDVVSRVSGGYATIAGPGSVDFQLGSPVYHSLEGGNCRLFDFRMTINVGDPARLVSAFISQITFDDWVQVRVDGQLVAADPASWTSAGNPPGNCERGATWYAYPRIDLKPLLTRGDHEIWLRVAVGNQGEALATLHADVDLSCKASEQLVDTCQALASNSKCQIADELVDGVETFRSGVNTGLKPLPQTRIVGDGSCAVQLTRDYFRKDRSYRCQLDTGTLPLPDLSRGAYIIDRSTETQLADRPRNENGSYAETTRSFGVPDRGAVPACEPVCKSRAPSVNTGAAPAGVVGSQQNAPTSFDTFFHACQADNVCPLGPGEELVSACGCLDDFPEAVVMMQTVRLAGADLLCTATSR